VGVINTFVRKTTDEMIAVMQAEKSGKTIQENHLDEADWDDVQFPCGWNWVSYDYRVKPVEPRRIFVPELNCGLHPNNFFTKENAVLSVKQDALNYTGCAEFIELTPEVRTKLGL